MADNILGQTKTVAPDQGTPGSAMGKIVLDATAIVVTDSLYIPVGFQPRYARLQASSGVTIEWFAGMAANTCFKTAANGARTLEVIGISVDSKGFRVIQNATLAAVLASSTVFYMALV